MNYCCGCSQEKWWRAIRCLAMKCVYVNLPVAHKIRVLPDDIGECVLTKHMEDSRIKDNNKRESNVYGGILTCV